MHEQILELIDGFRKSQVLFTAVRLGIFDGVRPPSPELPRLLEACLSLGLLERSAEDFKNSPAAEKYLKSSSPDSLAGYIRFAAVDLYPQWGRMAEKFAGPEGVRDWGGNADFVWGMHGYGMLSSPHVVAAFDLSRFQTFWDLGGATGHLALAMLDRYPHMKAGVFDFPAVIAHTMEYTRGRTDLMAGDLLTQALPPADLYGLGKVLHNLTAPQIDTLLGKIYRALPVGGALLAVERILDEDRSGPAHVHLSSLNMLVASMGRERTFSEYRVHLERAGFREIEIRKTGALVDVMLASK